MESYKLIREYNSEILVESVLDEATKTKSWSFKGVTLQSNKKNHNGRIYQIGRAHV